MRGSVKPVYVGSTPTRWTLNKHPLAKAGLCILLSDNLFADIDNLGLSPRQALQVNYMDINIDKFRIFIRDENDKKRSSTWYVTHQGNHVYLSVNSLGGTMKASFHPEGNSIDGKDSQFWFEKEYRKKLTNLPPSNRWIRPKTTASHVTQVAMVVFPTDYLRGLVLDERADYKRKSNTKRKYRFSLPVAKDGEAVELSLFYSAKSPDELETIFIQKGFTPMICMILPNGEIVSVVGRNVIFDPVSLPDFNRKHTVRELTGFNRISSHEANLHAILFNYPENGGVLQLIETNGLVLKKNST